jgi:hypothetical protein
MVDDMARDRSPRKRKPQAELDRQAMRKNAATKPRPLPGGMGMFDSGRTDTSQTYKELLRQAVRDRRWP